MTKNVELHLHKWSKMKGALGSVTETGSGGGFSGGSYSSWGGPAMSSYSGIGGSNSQGFANRIKSLVEITGKAKRAINELDVDGAIGNLHFHDDHVTAISLQSKLTALETYAGKVQQYLKDKIDQPFYEKLDKVGDRLEALNIASYKTSNQIGFKKTEVIYSEVGQYMGTREVLAKEVGLKELYQIDNPYKTSLQAQYEAYRSSDAYKESKLTEEDYLFASHQTRAFTYHSLNDEKASFEGVRDLVLGAGVVILSIFCPPAGAAAGLALASADMYSAVSGKDWGTGRELDDGERLMRGAFAMFDVIPGVGYVADLGKTGKVAGFAGIKASLKTSFNEGMEQAAKNADNFKLVLKHVDDFGKRVVRQVDGYGKQLTTFGLDLVDETVLGLSKAAQEGLERAKAFSLNRPTFGIGVDAVTGQRIMMVDVVETTVGDTHFGSKFLNSAEDILKNIESESLIRLKNREFSIPKVINNSDDYKQFVSKVAETKYLSLEEQVEQLQKAFQKVIDKTDINVPIDAKYVKKVMPEGWVDYYWPDKMGFQDGTIQGITKQTGLPEMWDRFGSMYGANFSDIPESGVYTYSQRSIPYVENPSAYHSGVFNKSSYFDKIDAIADGNLEKLNLILESEGLGSLTDFEFNDYVSNYNRNIKNIQSALGGDIEYYKYGVHGKAAPWEELVGGAEQIVPPFNGMDMINLGIIN